MKDQYRLDGHKLYWHPDRVADWMKGKPIAPLHIDVGLCKGCNIRCEYCFGALQGNFGREGAKIFFPREQLLRYIREAGEVGVRSMALIGEGEPLLNPHVYEAITTGIKAGVDMALGTNGILFDTGKKGVQALRELSWIRFNISAASEKAYSRIHNSGLFHTAVEKIRFCAETKKKFKLPVTIGLQMVLTPSNRDQVVDLAKLGKKLGVDYLVVKQCSDTIDGALGIFDELGSYKSYADLLKTAEAEAVPGYNVVIKWLKIGNEGKRNYARCLGAPFLLYSSGDGKLYPCGMCFDKSRGMEEDFRIADLTKESFKEAITSARYRKIMERIAGLDVSKCYSNCRTHAINEYAWMLKNPPGHVNFV
ncbi:MAG: radical SAM protein [Elusimicrobiales bacterium]|jgi:MoaA/NifB/PqqE/SkfB family radical SAM enzyme